jgi:hypothetical protein
MWVGGYGHWRTEHVHYCDRRAVRHCGKVGLCAVVCSGSCISTLLRCSNVFLVANKCGLGPVAHEVVDISHMCRWCVMHHIYAGDVVLTSMIIHTVCLLLYDHEEGCACDVSADEVVQLCWQHELVLTC